MTDTVLTLHNLSKHFGKKVALQNFSLNVKRGDIVGIAGRNGAGKTTLLRLIAGLSPIEAGSISLFGSLDTQGLEENRKYTGTIIEAPAFVPEMTARQNLEYYRVQRGLPNKKRVDELLELVGLHDTGKKKFKHFSLGMKQRLSIAQALLHQPDLLILDEPTNGLDPSGIIQIRELLLRLANETQLTILISSHILPELEHIATRFVIIDQGRKSTEFTKEEMKERTQHYYEIKVDDATKATVVLEQILQTTDYEVTDSQLIKLFDLSIQASDIADALVRNNLKLSHLTLKQHQLESLYLNLVEGGEQHD
ncbi:ABC transporter ATP-binding protein [Aerococcaceae bacterium NML130460]|nr:ABC transporter ATP-binding protein [Aerococcaceae bacterium NML130460]